MPEIAFLRDYRADIVPIP